MEWKQVYQLFFQPQLLNEHTLLKGIVKIPLIVTAIMMGLHYGLEASLMLEVTLWVLGISCIILETLLFYNYYLLCTRSLVAIEGVLLKVRSSQGFSGGPPYYFRIQVHQICDLSRSGLRPHEAGQTPQIMERKITTPGLGMAGARGRSQWFVATPSGEVIGLLRDNRVMGSPVPS